MIYADRLGAVVNEEEQHSYASHRQQHCSRDGSDRREGLWQGVRRRKRRRAIQEGAKEYAKRPLRTRSLAKLTMIRGENCIEASVSVINRIANTMETTVIIEAAMPARMTWAT